MAGFAVRDGNGNDRTLIGSVSGTDITLHKIIVDATGQPVTHADGGTFTPGTSGVIAVGVERDDTAPTVLGEGKIGVLRGNTNRALHVNLRDATTDRGVAVDANGSVQVILYTSGGSVVGTTGEGDGGSAFSACLGVTTHSYEYDEDTNTYTRPRLVKTSKTAQGTAVADSADVTVWTPASGKKFRLRGLVIAASVAGRYELHDGASGRIAYVRLAANDSLAIEMDANGIQSALANNTLLFRNKTGGAADMDAWAWGSEA